MSEFFDDLARALAKPIPRSRAVRTLAGALAALAVPEALLPRQAAASTRARPVDVTGSVSTRLAFCEKNCTGSTPVPCLCKNNRDKGPYAGCFETCGIAGSTCCCTKGPDGFNSGAVACPPGTRCGKPGEVNCPCLNTCGSPFSCCKVDEFCANPRQRLCCKNDERGCGNRCCASNEECKRIRVGTGSQTICTKRCPQGQAWCGKDKCCPSKWHCVNEETGLCRRCARDQKECGTKCCERGGTCCNPKKGLCCRRGETCTGFGGEAKCCPKGTTACSGTAGGKPICCRNGEVCAERSDPSGTVPAALRGKYTCCPPERMVGGKICCPPGYRSLGGRLVVPAGGGGGLCCRNDKLCGDTCCGTNADPGINQTCCNGKCVSLHFDSQNCGGCGRPCAPGQRCQSGTCVAA